MRLFEFHKNLMEFNKKFDEVLSQRSEVQLLDINEEKEQLNQEIIDLENQIKEERMKISRLKLFRIRPKNNEKDLEMGVNADFKKLNELLNLLDEKIKAYNA